MISPSSSSDHVTTPAPPAVAEEAAPLYKGRNLFQPFAKNPDKQERYEKFVAAKKSGNKGRFFSALAQELLLISWNKLTVLHNLIYSYPKSMVYGLE